MLTLWLYKSTIGENIVTTKMLAKSNGILFAIAFKSEKEQQLSLYIAIVGRAITVEREPLKK